MASYFSASVLGLGARAAVPEYPSKPIRLIIPEVTGGTPDMAGRIIAEELGRQMGRQVVVENRPGVGGIIGFEATARATPDGYTIGAATFPIATTPSLRAKLPYDPLKDLQMLVQLGSGVNLLTVSPSVAVHSVKDLIDLARKSPDKMAFGSAGNGTSMHLSMELLKQMTDIRLLHVPYRGIQQAIAEAIGGQIEIVCDNMPSILPHVKSGRMRAIAVTSPIRSTVLKEIPTVAEQGVPGYVMTPWSGYMTPVGVPPEIVRRLNVELNKAIRSPIMEEKYFAQNGIKLVGGTAEQFTEHVRREIAKWRQVLTAAGIRAE
jgi:tripartite-type tricarboxylate transporter receptor subunit TctC